MIGSWINIARAVKGMLDLGFSKKPEWVEEREYLKRGVEYQKQRFSERIAKPFNEGYHKDDRFWEVVKAHGDKRWAEIPASKEHWIYRGLCALSAASIFLVLALAARNVVDSDSLLPSVPVMGMIYFAYKAFRTRERKGYVWLWRGTSEPIDDRRCNK